MFNDEIKNKIIKKGIIRSEEDWDKASPEHLALAKLFYDLSESGHFGKSDPSIEEKILFLEETQALNDQSDLKNVDKVEPNKTFESDAVQIGIPVELLPFIRQIYSEILEGR
jgi:hypothetical protein